MSNSTFTPGPWYAHMQYVGGNEVFFITCGPGIFSSPCHAVTTNIEGAPLCGVCRKQEDGTPWPTEANARLIAAAPLLYEALRDALPLLKAAQSSWEDAAAASDTEWEEASCNLEVEKLENAVAAAQAALASAQPAPSTEEVKG